MRCRYCGGRHDRAAEVRACWERAAAHPQRVAAPPSSEASGAHPERVAAPPRSEAADAAAVAALGRSVVVPPGAEAPPAWTGCDRVPENTTTDDLERAWRERTPLVIECAAAPPGDEAIHVPVWSLSPGFAFEGERRAHALFTNALDARGPERRWHFTEEAVRLGATAGGAGDVVLPDGRQAFCDGGPLEWKAPIDGVCVLPRVSLLGGSLIPFGENETTAELAPDQRAAVCHESGAARIIAPAGSGKTRVLTERARHLLGRWKLPAGALTLVAFNTRAAGEMRERTPDLPNLQVRTLNALGLSLVTGSEPSTTIEERDVRTILDGLVDLPRRANADPAAAWIEALSIVRLGLRSPQEVEAEFAGDVDGLPEVLERYRRTLNERRLLDFDEQIYRAIEILLADSGARRRARAACRVLLVDEFQDLTPAHLLLVRLLAGPEAAVFGVGDDDQTIYGYSGASPEWLIGYRQYFPSAGAHALEVNYRCPPAVVEAARTLLTHNRRRVDKKMTPAPGRPVGDPSLVVCRDPDPLAATVQIVASRVDGGAAPADIAILTRVNASLAPVQVALVHRGVPLQPAVDATYLSRGGVRAALAWLGLASAPAERLAPSDVVAAARRPSRGLSPKLLDWMSEQRSVRGIERLAGRMSADRDRDKVVGFAADVRAARDAADEGTPAVLRLVRDSIGLDQAMQLLEASRRRLERSAQTDDLDALLALAVLHPEVGGFQSWLRHSLSEPGSPEGVTLATVHRVKGREWPHVVLYGVDAGLMPHRLAFDVEEERRVFHVGLTRCRETVDVVCGEVPSPFVAEMSAEWTPEHRQPQARPAITRAAGDRREASRSTRRAGTRSDVAEVSAALGLELDYTGQRLTVALVDDEGVLAVTGQARVRIPYGALVGVAGTMARLAPEPLPDEVVSRAREALRTWRAQRASADGKPAYVYLHDETLEALARTLPTTMVGLARVRGIGPAKLDAYGDEWLAILAEARGGGSERSDPKQAS